MKWRWTAKRTNAAGSRSDPTESAEDEGYRESIPPSSALDKVASPPDHPHPRLSRLIRSATQPTSRADAGEGVAVTLTRHPILHDIALGLRPGELVALCGPNGAGKTTLLRALAGLLPGSPQRDPRHVVYLPQNARCAWALTVEQVAALGRIPHRDSAGAPVTRALQNCGILPLRDRRVDRISGGEARRAMLARAFATEPRVFLLDEPTADLDPAAAQAIMRLLRQTAEAGRTVVVVQHAVELAIRYAHRIVVMQAGHIVADLPAANALPALAAAFGLPFGIDPEPRLLPNDDRDAPH